MAPLPIALASKSNTSRHGVEGAARLINCEAEPLGEEGKSTFAVYSCPGLTTYASLTGSGGVRAMLDVDDLLYAVHGRSISRIQDSGANAVIGGIGSDGLVTMARNRRDDPHVGIVCDGQYWIATRDTFAQVFITDLPPPNSVCELDGYFVFGINDGRMFASDLNDGRTVNPLSMAKAEASADGLVRVFTRNRDLIASGPKSTEFWNDTGGDPFPFSRSTTIDIGCWSAGSVASVTVTKGGTITDAVGWIASGKDGAYAGVALLMGGYQPQKISTYQADRDISTDPNPSAIRGFGYSINGHSYYAIRGSTYTWVWDAATGLPHERKSYGLDVWRPSCSVVFGERQLLGDGTASTVLALDKDARDETGEPIVCVCQCPVTHAIPNRIKWGSLTPEAIATPLRLGTPGPIAPKVMVDWSHDGGRTWSAQIIGDGVIVGNRVERIRPIRRLGVSPVAGRTWRFSWQASDLHGLIACNADVEKIPA